MPSQLRTHGSHNRAVSDRLGKPQSLNIHYLKDLSHAMTGTKIAEEHLEERWKLLADD